jgi:hypothetical protein
MGEHFNTAMLRKAFPPRKPIVTRRVEARVPEAVTQAPPPPSSEAAPNEYRACKTCGEAVELTSGWAMARHSRSVHPKKKVAA